MKIFFFIKLLIFFLLLISTAVATQSDYFTEGVKLYQKKKFDESKIIFERDIVFNPTSEKSYLYLAKIFNAKNNEEEEEINLSKVLLLNPKNDEAIYMLILLKIKQSDYNQAKELVDRFVLICKAFCSKNDEIKEKFKKLIPENAEIKN